MGKKEGLIIDTYPDWLRINVPSEYEDEGLFEIILFFIIHSPCGNQSFKKIALETRGWKSKPWHSKKYLKEKLDNAIWGTEQRMLKMVESKEKIISEVNSMDLGKNFYNHREKQRMLYSKINDNECKSEYMSLFYHIRNSLAHGRFTLYPTKNKDLVFVMEDGKRVGKDEENKFELSARIVINKSSLLRIIDVLKNPPKEKDYSDEFLNTIREGKNVKKQIISYLDINEDIYKTTINKLKDAGLIKSVKNKWFVIEN